jgi:hypothetical protein
MLTGNSELVRRLPAEKHRRWIILAVICVDLIGVLRTEPNAIRDTANLVGGQIAPAARTAL